MTDDARGLRRAARCSGLLGLVPLALAQDTVAYFTALRRAVDAANAQRATKFQFWSDLEAFAFLQDYWVPAAVGTRRPAPVSRLTGQLAAEARSRIREW